MPLDTTAPPATLDLEVLLAHRSRLRAHEEQLSYWRRVVQGRLDLVRARLEGADAMTALPGVLGLENHHATRVAHVLVRPADPMPELAPADDAWDLASTSEDEDVLVSALERLTVAEHWLSAQRQDVLAALDEATAELATRLQEDPAEYLRRVGQCWVPSAG